MVKGIVNVKVTDRFGDLKNSVAGLMNKTVLVGIPEEEATREGGGEINNAELLYIHSQGSPLKKIPARPVLEPSIEANKETLGRQYGKAVKASLDGNDALMEEELRKTGQRAENFAKRWFDDERNNWPPNSPKTAERKILKGKGKIFNHLRQHYADTGTLSDVTGLEGLARPLIDTDEMRKSITHVVRDK